MGSRWKQVRAVAETQRGAASCKPETGLVRFGVLGLSMILGTNLILSAAAATCYPAPAGLVGWWPGDGNGQDIIGGHNGTLKGGATATAAGKVAQAFSFDGTNSFVEIADSPAFHLPTLTVECWVRFDAYRTPGTSAYPYQQYIVFKQSSRSYEFEGFALTKDLGPDNVRNVILWEVASGSGVLARIDSVNTVVTNTWYHLAGVRGSNYIQLYLDGHLEVQATVNFPQDYGTLPLYFGTSGQAYYDRKLQGRLDEVSLYNRALSGAEIAALYAAGAAGKCKPGSPIDLVLSDPVIHGSQISFMLQGESGRSYEIEVSSNMQQWLPLQTVTLSGITTNISAPATQTYQSYRARLIP